MNTALHASPPTESKRTSTHSAHHERDLSIQLPREEELRTLSLTQRLALRVALHLIVRARSEEQDQDRVRRHLARARRIEHVERQRALCENRRQIL